MCKNKCKIKTCYTSSKEISDYKCNYIVLYTIKSKHTDTYKNIIEKLFVDYLRNEYLQIKKKQNS